MKRAIAVILMLTLAIFAAGCGADGGKKADETAAAGNSDADLAAEIEDTLGGKKYNGIIYLTHNGEVVYQRATGTDADGEPLAVDTSMYIGSVSKQFCAAAVMILRDQGKLSVDDTIDKYFPRYDKGKDVTVKNLLTMRSGIPDMVNEGKVDDLSADNTEEENGAAIKEWIFSQPLHFEPDSEYRYSNSNYFLLADIVEQVSGQYYNDFLRENIFELLGMDHTGLITEIPDSPAWAEKLIADDDVQEVKCKGIAKGAGDVVSNALDMAKWMEGLIGGKVVKEETYREMTTDYSGDSGSSYGYGLMPMFAGGAGHPGMIASYSAVDYMNPENGYCLFCNSNSSLSDDMPALLLGNFLRE